MKTIKRYSVNARQWLARMLQTRAARCIMLSLMVLLGLIFLAKGVHTAWFWRASIAKMQEQFIPTGWAKELTASNVVLTLIIGLGLVASLWFGRIRNVALAAACTLLFVYAAYSRMVRIEWIMDSPPCACVGWLNGMSWSDVLRTNIILLVITTIIWFAYPKKERRSVQKHDI